MPEKPKHPVKSLYTTAEIIEGLEELNGARVTELAAHLERPQSVIHNHLRTLQELEYVVKEESEYKISLLFLQRGASVRNQMSLYTAAKPVIKKLANETSELITLLVEEHGRGVYLDIAQANREVHYPAIPGTRVRLHCCATGKTLLAHYSEEKVDRIIERHCLPAQSQYTITDRDELREELDKIRDRGYAMDRQEFREGMKSVAAPIFDEERRVIGSVSIAGPTHRMTEQRIQDDLLDTLLQSINIIELNRNEPTIK